MRPTVRRLRAVRVVAALDAALLVALVAASALDVRPAVAVLGPVHGANVLALVAMTLNGAGEGLWSWAFPLGIVATGGPVGAFVGEWLVRRRLRHGEDSAAPRPVLLGGRTPLPLR